MTWLESLWPELVGALFGLAALCLPLLLAWAIVSWQLRKRGPGR